MWPATVFLGEGLNVWGREHEQAGFVSDAAAHIGLSNERGNSGGVGP